MVINKINKAVYYAYRSNSWGYGPLDGDITLNDLTNNNNTWNLRNMQRRS